MNKICKACGGMIEAGNREAQALGGHTSCVKGRLGKILLQLPTELRSRVCGPLSGASTKAALTEAAMLTGRELLSVAVNYPAQWAGFTGWFEQFVGPLPDLAKFRSYKTLRERMEERGRLATPPPIPASRRRPEHSALI